MATAYADVTSASGGPYYVYTLYVSAPSSRTGNSISISYEFWARLQNSGSYDGDKSMWFDIGGKGGGDTTAWGSWNSHGNVTFRSGEWSGSTWHGPWTGSFTVSKEIYDNTTGVRIRLWVNRESGDAGKIDKRDYVLKIPARTIYTITYNGNSTYNGYTNSTVTLPTSSQSKYYDVNITTSSAPTKAQTTANGYTVTYNYNYSGSTNTTATPTDTYTYTFSKWNTSSDGKGTNYTASSTYSSNSSATLYAIWNRSVSKGSVTLPTPTRAGFTFLGWSTNSTATTGTYSGGSNYTPSAAVTLYAIWRANLGEGYVLKATSNSSTWIDLIASQTTPGSTLYAAGGEYSGWSIDSLGFVLCFGFRIKLNGSTLVKGYDKPIRGAKYYYYIS